MSVGADFYTSLIASTREAIDTRELVDNVLTQHPLLDLFKSNAKSYTGRSVIVNVEAAENGSSAFTDASGSFSTSIDSDIVGTASFPWASPLVSKTRLAFATIEQNQGSEQIVDLVKAHMKAAEKGHAKTLAAALYNPMPAAGQPASLPVIVAEGTVLGGIDGDDKAYWNAIVIDSDIETEPIKVAFRRALNQLFIAGAGGRPTHLVCGVGVYEEYESSLDESTRAMMTASPSTVDGRFRELKFDGLVVRLDPDCNENQAYFLTADDLVLGYLGDNWMKVQPAQTLPGTLDVVTPIVSVVTVGVRQRRTHAVLNRGSM